MDIYSPYFVFDEIHLFDASDLPDVPTGQNVSSKIITRKAFLQVGTRNDGDLVHLLPSIVKEEDFVVLMWDTDIVANPVTLEWGFLADLLSQNHSLVDELFIELHFPYQRIGWIYEHHSAREAFELLQQLRKQCNFAVHAWP